LNAQPVAVAFILNDVANVDDDDALPPGHKEGHVERDETATTKTTFTECVWLVLMFSLPSS